MRRVLRVSVWTWGDAVACMADGVEVEMGGFELSSKDVSPGCAERKSVGHRRSTSRSSQRCRLVTHGRCRRRNTVSGHSFELQN